MTLATSPLTRNQESLDTLSPVLAKTLIKFLLRAGRKVMLRGESGVGKTEMVGQVAQEEGYEGIIELHPAWLSDVDVRGIPDKIMINGKMFTGWLPPEFMSFSGKWILLIDEINRGLPSTINALMQLVREGRIGEVRLSPETRFVATMNPSGSAAGGQTIQLNQAFEGSFSHITIKTDVKDWLAWAAQNDIHPAVQAWIKFRPEALHKVVKGAYAWASPRSNKYLSDVFKQNLPREVELTAACGTIGEEFGVPFVAFWRNYLELGSLVPNILMAPNAAKVPETGQLQYAVCSALIEHASPANIAKILIYLDRVGADMRQFAVDAIVGRKPECCQTEAYINWAMARS